MTVDSESIHCFFRQFQKSEVLLGVEVVLIRLVNDPQVPIVSGDGIG